MTFLNYLFQVTLSFLPTIVKCTTFRNVTTSFKKDLDTFNNSCEKNRKTVNFLKTVVITFGIYADLFDYTKLISGNLIRVKETKNLQLIVDQGLTFKSHCLKIIKKANLFAYNVLKIFKSCSLQNTFLIFNT